MEERESQDKDVLFGLVGKRISYSFSKEYFSKKFAELNLTHHKYVNFDIEKITFFPEVIHSNKFKLKGMNVTIPYKQDVFLYLDKVHKVARKVGAVNTIKITKKGKLKGYNTDVIGFRNSIAPMLKEHHTKALILGSGGASKAVAYVFKKMNIDFKFVSRKPKKKKQISYADINEEVLNEYGIIVNCSPVGTFPETDKCPKIPYQHITEKHLFYDLVYNPKETLFLTKGKLQGASIKNGYEMLEIQAEASWEIWNS
ncbi:shikimate dehydrogenase [Flavobacteriaceae bacterium S356]|uniref:Shikimate dehydrogenase n=1 Tax=Asprobacillus argus TaxID=3076534 RepID=A0ABU3LGN6_9FLAO|nr:shikimate dehydrogenase [Flavobacteriaceae bacterium S356]